MLPVPEQQKPVVIPRRIDYFELGVFSFATLYGVITLVNYSSLAARSVQVYPGVGGKVFLIMLAVGGCTGLVSFAFRSLMGLKLELASLTLLVCLCLAYTLWTPFSVGVQGIGLLLSLAVLIGIPGYFTRRRLLNLIHYVEGIARDQHMGGRESEARANSNAVVRQHSRRWRRR
jgi:hypothetical protein